MLLLAQAIAGMSILKMIIIVIVIAAAIGIMLVALKQFGVQLPPWLMTIFWIVVVAIVAIFAVKLVWGLL